MTSAITVLHRLMGRYTSVWAVDFEFTARPGELVRVICMVAIDLFSGRVVRLWADDLAKLTCAPFDTGPKALFVAYFATAEALAFLALGWPAPANLIDLFVEFRVRTNGLPLVHGRGLLGALAYFGLDGIHALEKAEMRELANRGEPYPPEERRPLLDYCQTDVVALAALLPAMVDQLDLDRALLRGAYMFALARVEATGVPIDAATWRLLLKHWARLRAWIIAQVDEAYGVYVNGSFTISRFDAWLLRAGIPWPRLPSGRLRLDGETFDAMALSHPRVRGLRDLRATLGKMTTPKLAVGRDGRNRVMLSAFSSKTGRNQPSNAAFIFGAARWMRWLIRPVQGRAIAYIDWEQQEFAIAAWLSGDANMIAAYLSGDCYMAFAILDGAAPVGATKATHGAVRDKYKRCVLATQYLMSAESLAVSMGCDFATARALLDAHRKTFTTFWAWAERHYNAAALSGRAVATYGWPLHLTNETKARTVYNFPMQANGAEMLRIAIILAIDAGLEVCAPVHDAILIEADADAIDAAVAKAQECMAQASAYVLGGFRLRTDAEIVRWPDRFPGKAGDPILAAVQSFLATVAP